MRVVSIYALTIILIKVNAVWPTVLAPPKTLRSSWWDSNPQPTNKSLMQAEAAEAEEHPLYAEARETAARRLPLEEEVLAGNLTQPHCG